MQRLFLAQLTPRKTEREHRCPGKNTARKSKCYRVQIKTRDAPVKIDDTEIEAIQACVDAAISGQTQVLGYVDADFQQRNMNGTTRQDFDMIILS